MWRAAGIVALAVGLLPAAFFTGTTVGLAITHWQHREEIRLIQADKARARLSAPIDLDPSVTTLDEVMGSDEGEGLITSIGVPNAMAFSSPPAILTLIVGAVIVASWWALWALLWRQLAQRRGLLMSAGLYAAVTVFFAYKAATVWGVF